MKKVLLVTDFFRPEPGGLEGLFTGIARKWQNGNIEVLITLGEKEFITAHDERASFDRLESYPINRVRAADFLRRNPQFDAVLRQRFEMFAPRHVILGNISAGTIRAAAIAREYGINYSLFLLGGDLKNRLGFINFRARRLLLGARNIFTLSRHMSESARFLGVPEDRITVVPPGLELRWNRFRKFSVPQPIYDRIKNKIVLLSVGPFLPRKGLDMAIEAMHRLHGGEGARLKLHLVIVGSGPESTYLQELVRIHGLEESVTMTGFLGDDQLAGLFGLAHIFLQPGALRKDDVESLGTALMEAAHFGLPAIAGRIGPVEEIVKHGHSGFLFEPGNIDEMCRQIVDLAGSDRMQQKLGRNARDVAGKEYDLARSCNAISARI